MAWNGYFVHDGTEGIYVDAPADLARQPAGRVVRLDGFTDPGDFAPMIHAARVTPVRDGRLPHHTALPPSRASRLREARIGATMAAA